MKKATGGRLKAFTLLELVVVIAIIVVLTAIAVPATITMIRDSKTTAANDTAQQVYMAAQDYLVTLQINGKSATDYFGTATSGVAYIGCVNDVTQEAKKNGGKTAKIIHFSEDASATHDEIKGGSSDNTNRAAAVNEILSRLPADFQGAWAVEIYPATYTVKCAYYSEIEGTDHGYNWAGVEAVKAAPFKNSGEQETEMNKPSSDKKSVGQYPFIP